MQSKSPGRRRRWRRGIRPAVVAALASVVAGYFANIVSGGNHSFTAIAGFGIAVLALLGSAWWESTHRPSISSGRSVDADQNVGRAHDSTVVGVEADDGDGQYRLRQHVTDAEGSDVIGVRVRRVPPRDSRE